MVKLKLEIKAPEKVDENLGKALVIAASAFKDITSTCSKVTNLLADGSCTLLAPVASYLKGESYKIADKYLPFQNRVEMRKEISQIKLAQYVLEGLADKEQRGEDLPPKIEDTDTLFSIHNAASETTDEDFIKFWAKLYTEEACKPNTVSKKTVNLCKDLDKEVVQALENDIFPYCDEHGFYWGNANKNIKSINIAKEYGFLRASEQSLTSKYIDNFIDIKIGQYYIYVIPGYSYEVWYSGKILTNCALEVRKCLKLQRDIDLNDVLKQIKEISNYWQITDQFKSYMNYKNGCSNKFFITEKNKIVYPTEFVGKDMGQIYNEILSNIEYKDEAKQFFAPDLIRLIMHE